MNRNRFFMWAYITFVVVAAILRMCFEFSVWTPIVVAISISSVFFSAEDFCNRISKYYEEYWVTNQEVIDKVKVEFKNLKKGAQNAEDMVKECRNIGLDLPDTFLNSIRTQVPPTTLEKDILLEEERLLIITNK